ncbi:MAG: hypothetical protein U5K79_06470 [Cyclobacteriaceae bacterium]|nr:hypothetical protein [Cyclobacteriaceae bacterium]
MMGNLYFADTVYKRSVLSEYIEPTMLAYQLLKYDSSTYENELRRIRNYFLENRAQGHWKNTYESARIIETILPDILEGERSVIPPHLELSGTLRQPIDSFPYSTKLESDAQLTISKTGNLPVYISAHQSRWNPSPEIKKEDFEISTAFSTPDEKVLTAGKPVKLVVNLEVKKDAEFVMVEVPIPAGCSYQSKENNHRLNWHYEYFRDRTSIFCEFLRAGHYSFEIELMPRYTGVYSTNPAKAALMYFPVKYGNTQVKAVRID